MEAPGPEDMNHVHQVILNKYLLGRGVEGNTGIYDRVQFLKKLLAQQLTPDLNSHLSESPLNKILLVLHSRVLQAFSASGINREILKDDG